MSDTLAALEAALRQTPDDPVLLDAITDYFLDRDDPRGEYLLSCRNRDRFTRDYLFEKHRLEWARPLSVDSPMRWHYCWVNAAKLTVVSDRNLVDLTSVPLLSHLTVEPGGGFLRSPDVYHGNVSHGDDIPRHLIASGLIDRLDSLTLENAGITDDGALALANCPAVSRLKSLKLPRCQISPIGLDALAGVGHRDVGRQNLTPWLDPADDD